jgi:hypothetical protein
MSAPWHGITGSGHRDMEAIGITRDHTAAVSCVWLIHHAGYCVPSIFPAPARDA